jgi:hypothetical protein
MSSANGVNAQERGGAIMRVLLVAASVFLFAGAAFAQPQGMEQGQGPPRSGELGSVTCRIGNVAAFRDRVHIRCAGDITSQLQAQMQAMQSAMQGGGGGNAQTAAAPTYFAVGVQSEPALANLVLSLATQASAQNKQVQIYFDPSPSANPLGCHPSDCRRLAGLLMVVQN